MLSAGATTSARCWPAPRAVLACWVRHDRSRRLRPPGGAVPALARRRAEWGTASQPSPATVPACPTARTSAVSRSKAGAAASTSRGSTRRTRRGLDSAWVARATAGTGRRRSAPRASGRSPSASRATASATSRCSRSPRRADGSISCMRPQADVQVVRLRTPGSSRSRSPPARSSRASPRPGTTCTSPSSTGGWRRRSWTSGSRRRTTAGAAGSAAALARFVGSGDRRAALAHRRLLGDHQALAADRCGAVALAADPHLANAGAATATSTVARRQRPPAALRLDSTGDAISLRGMSTRERIQELAEQIVALRDAYYRASRRWRTPSTTRSRTSCGR